jgi:His/Glu/Gln/Arg/opine family amino acid ABC transporter permease subunit
MHAIRGGRTVTEALASFRIRTWCIILLLATTCLTLPAEAQEETQPFRVALTGKYPPFSYYNNDGELAGFDVDVSREIGGRLGRSVEILATEWDGILAGLLAGKYDAIIGSMAITPERAQSVSFSDPYYESGAQLFVHRDNPDKVYSIRECEGLGIAAVLGETFQRYLEQEHPAIEVVTLKSSVEIFELLEQQRIAGFVSDRLVGLWQIKSAARPFVPVGNMLYAERMAIPVRKEDTRLLTDINEALREMREDGTMESIHSKYFGLVGSRLSSPTGEMSPGVIAAKLLKGFAITLCIAAAALAIGFVLAVPCGLILNHPGGGLALLYWPVRTTVDFLRGTPVLIQLLFAWMGLGLPPLVAAIGTLAVNSMAYMAEVIRAGLMSVDRGQVLAGKALALTRWQVFRHVIWPQAFRVAIPPLMNSVVALTKDTALVAVISVAEVIREAQSIISVTFEPTKYYFIVALMFFVVTFPLMKLAGIMENRIRQKGYARD